MPFRRREQPRQLAFEAVDDLDDVDDRFPPPPAPPGAPTGPPGTPPDGVAHVASDDAGTSGGQDGSDPVLRDPRARRRRRLLVASVAGALVLTLGGLTVLDTVRARQADALLRTAHGGVVGLTQPPREVWSLDSGEGWPVFAGNRILLAQEDALVAHDLASGEEVWRLEALAGFRCQADDSSAAAIAASTAVTCLGGGTSLEAVPREPDTTVAVVGLGGEVLARRELDLSRGLSEVLSDGDLARGVMDGRGAVVSVEDARTGEVRWTRTVPGDGAAEQDESCVVAQENGTTARPQDRMSFDDRDGVLAIYGCGTGGTFTREGDPLSGIDDAFVHSLRDGRLARMPFDGGPTEVLDADGTPLWSTQGAFLEPVATDGTAPPILYSQYGSGFVAFDVEGRELWTFPRYTNQILLATQDVTVVATYPGAVAVDNATGEALWTWKDPAPDGSVAASVTAAFAGRGTLTVVAGTDPVERTRWHSIDLVDGSTRWSTTIPVDAWMLTAVDGRLYSAAPGKITAFG